MHMRIGVISYVHGRKSFKNKYLVHCDMLAQLATVHDHT